MAPCGTGVPPVVPVWHRFATGVRGRLPVLPPIAYTVRHARQTLVEESTARHGKAIIALTVREILEEEIARKLA